MKMNEYHIVENKELLWSSVSNKMGSILAKIDKTIDNTTLMLRKENYPTN